MKPIDYILLGALALILGGVILHLRKRKREGKGGCGCGCANCPSKGNCGAREEKNEETA